MERNNELNTSESTMSFEPIVIILDVLKRWLLIVLVALAVGVGAYIISDTVYSPRYTCKMTFVVTDRSSSATVYSRLSSAKELASVFSELLNSSILRKEILADIGKTSFDGSISSSTISETNLVTVSVTASDPRTAFQVAQSIIDHHEDVTYQVVDGVALELLQYPTVPTAPSNRSATSSFMKKVALFAAAAMAALLAVLSYLRDTVRSGREARKKLDCRYLGEIPHEKKYKTLYARLRHRKTSILVCNPATSFFYIESIRKLRHRVEQRMHGRQVLMVTSIQENEGKSTVAANLALSLAQKDARVLLIDGDLRKPACHLVLGQKFISNTLTDVLTGKAQVQDAVIHHRVGNLHLLLDKRHHNNSGDLLSSDQMKELLSWARSEYDFVVLDLPPMAVTSDAELMAEYVDASLLVVRQNVSTAKVLNTSIEALDGSKSKLLGCVLNNVYSAAPTLGYGYYYGSYGRYGNYDNAYRTRK